MKAGAVVQLTRNMYYLAVRLAVNNGPSKNASACINQDKKMNQRLLTLFCAVLAFSPIQAVTALEAGVTAPDCKLSALADAQPLAIQQFRGKVMYVDFWASWCGPCAKSFPFLNELDAEFKARGLQIVGVNMDENAADAQAFLAKYPANFMVASGVDGQCAKDFGVQAMPSSYIIDRKGIVRQVHLGFRAGEAKELKALVERLLAEKSE